MKILVIDGQGGGLGKAIMEKLRLALPDETIIAVGTNSAATSSMLKGGATAGATGENALIHNCADADIIVGPFGIVIANAMLGEISPAMAVAVSASPAEKVLIPASRCRVHIAGVENNMLSKYIDEAVETAAQLASAAK